MYRTWNTSLALSGVIVLYSLALAAPAPKAKPAEGFTPGTYRQTWWGSPYIVRLYANGDYVSQAEGSDSAPWVGRWSWDAQKRELTVSETQRFHDGGEGSTYKWVFKPDAKLSGKASCNSESFHVELTWRRLPAPR